ncbi:MAG: glycosyltransferase [Rhizobacter sp.]|nr:glycosyltransferase [Ferruginibacter sp.]
MPQSKNVLFISYDGMTDPLGQSQVIPYLQGISKAGYRIFILSCEKKEVFNETRADIEELLKGFNIEWVPISYTKKPPLFSTLWDIRKLKQAARKIHKTHIISMVHTRPGIPALVGIWMKEKYGVKFLNDIREFFADSRVEGNMWNLANPLYNKVYHYFKKKESQAVIMNDGIVCLTNAARDIIVQWPEFKRGTALRMIPCSVDTQLFNPERIAAADKKRLQEELNINENDLVVGYLGSIGGWYMSSEMLLFCKLLSDKIPAVKFLFISPHRHEVILTAASTAGLSGDKIITVKGKRSRIPLLLSLCDYSIFFIKPCYSKLSSSPTKHGEIMAMGIPVITNSGVGDVKEIVEKYQSGYIVDGFGGADFAKVIDQVMDEPAFDTNAIIAGARETYGLEHAVKSYIEIYNEILS